MTYPTPILVYQSHCSEIGLRSIDGRHTIQALIYRKYKQWTCDIHIDMDDMTAARVFHELTQNSQRMGVFDAYDAAIAGEYPFALAIQESIKTNGFTIKDFTGISSLIEAQIGGILPVFMSTLKMWKNSGWKIAKKNPFQRGLLDFIKAGGNVKRIEHESVDDIMEIARKNCERVDRNHYRKAFETISGLRRAA